MTATEFKITEGPGEWDSVTALLRGGEIQVKILDSDGITKKTKIRIPKTELLNITGAEIEVAPGIFIRLEEFFYGPKSRSGSLSFICPQIEEHPVCGHIVLKGERYCHLCGRDRMDGE
jgi:hypothetical protein